MVRQKKISKKSSSEIASASVLPTLLENSFFSDEAFDFEMDTMDIGEDVVEAVVTNVPDSSTNLYTPNFFNARPSTPPIMDPNKLEVFTPGEEDPQRAAQVLIRGQIYL